MLKFKPVMVKATAYSVWVVSVTSVGFGSLLTTSSFAYTPLQALLGPLAVNATVMLTGTICSLIAISLAFGSKFADERLDNQHILAAFMTVLLVALANIAVLGNFLLTPVAAADQTHPLLFVTIMVMVFMGVAASAAFYMLDQWKAGCVSPHVARIPFFLLSPLTLWVFHSIQDWRLTVGLLVLQGLLSTVITIEKFNTSTEAKKCPETAVA